MGLQSQLLSHESLHEHLDPLPSAAIISLKGLDDSGIQAGHSDANLLDLRLFNFNCTFGRGPGIFIFPMQPFATTFTSAIKVALAASFRRMLRPKTNYKPSSAPSNSSPPNLDQCVPAYAGAAKDDICQNRGNAAEQVGFLGRVMMPLWIGFGALAEIGLENKHSVLIFGFGLVVGLLLTPERRVLRTRWLWAGGRLAFLTFLPNLLWNIEHRFPFLELQENIRRSGRNAMSYMCSLRIAPGSRTIRTLSG
jgi:hypothetical protein